MSKLISDERRAMLKRMDPEEIIAFWMKEQLVKKVGPAADSHVYLAGAHRARVIAARAFTGAEVRASKEWLRTHGYSVP